MRLVRIVRDYIPTAECDELNAWTLDACATGKMVPGIGQFGRRNPLRLTSRLVPDQNVEFPGLTWDIKARIEADFGLAKWSEPVHTLGRKGVVVTATTEGGDLYEHTDRVMGNEPHTLRCNVLTSASQGSEVHVLDEVFNLRKGDMMQFIVTRHRHGVAPAIGKDALRILWMFGWFVDADEWEAKLNEEPMETI
jgi:hypothetical protein